MQFIWLSTIFFVSAVLEFIIAGIGILIPLVTLTAFYCFITFRASAVVPLAVLTAASLDLILGRSLILHTGVLALVGVAAQQWIRRGDCTVTLLQALPGAVCALAWACIMITGESLAEENVFPELFMHNILLIIEVVIISAVLTPLGIHALDYGAAILEQPQYSNSQTRENRY